MKVLSIIAAACLGMAGCVSTTHFSDEYRRAYVLRNDTVVEHCQIFTGVYSLYFGGLENVLCFRTSKMRKPDDAIIKSGSVVQVKRLYRIGAVDAFYDTAELSVLDHATGKAMTVYLENWPDKDKVLQSR